MKLNWFSPLPPAKTDIGHYTARILPALRKHTEVILWTDQPVWDASLNQLAEVRRYHPDHMPWRDLNRADMTVYNIGNNPVFHGTIWRVSQQHAGVVVLHDFNLQELFYSLYLDAWQDLDAYLTQMEFYYGKAGRTEANDCVKQRGSPLRGLIERYPLTQLGIENALGVLSHTTAAEKKLKRDLNFPVTYAPLPFVSDVERVGCLPARREEAPYHLVVFGYLGPNRRLAELLRALEGFSAQFKLHIYGELANENQLRRLIKKLKLSESVTVHGFVTESELDQALSTAHLAINLRNPTAGEASGSQLRIWSHGLPSLVSCVGWYATLPKGTVKFVNPDQEVEELREYFRAFLKDPTSFAKTGRRGFAVYRKEHQPEQYVESLLKLVSLAQETRHVPALKRLVLRATLATPDQLPETVRHDRWLAPFVDSHMIKDEGWLRLAKKKLELINGRSRSSLERPLLSFTKRVKRFIRLRLPPRLYDYYVVQRDRIRGY